MLTLLLVLPLFVLCLLFMLPLLRESVQRHTASRAESARRRRWRKIDT